MNEKKSGNITALILSIVVALVAVFGVNMAGGSMKEKEPAGPVVTPGESQGEEAAGKYGAGTYTAEAQGMGKVVVTLTVDANNIVDLQIDASGETTGIGDQAAAKLQTAIMDAQSADVSAVSGASITSGAVLTAVNDALAQAAAAAGGAADGAEEAAGKYVAGTYTAEAQGMGKVVVTVIVDANSIVDVQIDASGETTGIGDQAAVKLQAAIMDAQSAEVDAVGGASITSKAVITAVTDALAQAAAN